MGASIGDLVSLGLQGTQVMRGWQEVIKPADPAAGAGFSRTVPGETWERLLAVSFTFATSAVVASRTARLELQDGDSAVIAAAPATGSVAAGSFVFPRLVAGGPQVSNGIAGNTYGFLPDLIAPAGWEWNLIITNIDAGDQVSAVRMLVQRFPTSHVKELAGELAAQTQHTERAAHWAKLTYERINAWLGG